LSSLDISLDLVDRDSVFSPFPGERDVEVEPRFEGGARCEGMAGPRRAAKRVDGDAKGEPEKPACSEKEQRDLEADLERLADRLTATLSAACSRKKKRRK